eukprot:4739708-Amphidinium_carterae.1
MPRHLNGSIMEQYEHKLDTIERCLASGGLRANINLEPSFCQVLGTRAGADFYSSHWSTDMKLP